MRASSAPVGDLVIVDTSVALVELLTEHLGSPERHVEGVWEIETAIAGARDRATRPPALALVTLGPADHRPNGLDVMLAYARWCPETSLIAWVDEERDGPELLQVAWEAMAPTAVVSKGSSLADLAATLDQVDRQGWADPDERLRSCLPPHRSPWRTAQAYGRLVPHAGHAKVWQVLLESEVAPAYKVIAERSGLAVNTIRNYREDLLPELRLHGLEAPTMQDIHRFAHLVRPLLDPVVEARLSGRPGTDRSLTAVG